jgi:hypothetical protein
MLAPCMVLNGCLLTAVCHGTMHDLDGMPANSTVWSHRLQESWQRLQACASARGFVQAEQQRL